MAKEACCPTSISPTFKYGVEHLVQLTACLQQFLVVQQIDPVIHVRNQPRAYIMCTRARLGYPPSYCATFNGLVVNALN